MSQSDAQSNDGALKVGLEIHGYILVSQKLFCDCAISESDTTPPNTNICPVCTGQPGSKPMLTNKIALEKSIQIGLMLGCKINPRLMFQRKHYSWPDSPNNYQRTMSGSYASPVGEHGSFEGIRIRQVHLEEDPAKWDPNTGRIDYNRAGFPLIEIVTEPDFTTPEQVKEWLQKLVTTLSFIKTLNKTAGIKCDVNVSIAPKYERVEIKNVNSQTAIVEAILCEQKRQIEEVAQGKTIPMQTRAWNDDEKITQFMRSKESAEDYMFIPDPDIPFVNVDEKYLASLKAVLPEPPSVKKQKLIANGLSADTSDTISRSYNLITAFETGTGKSYNISAGITGSTLSKEVVNYAATRNIDVDDVTLNKPFFNLLKHADIKKITIQTMQKIFKKEFPFEDSLDIHNYVQAQNLYSVSDDGALEAMCKKAIDANPKAVADYKAGNENSFNFLIGQVMRESKGAAKPDVLRPIMKKLLN